MPTDIATIQSQSGHSPESTVVNGELRCALTGKPLRADEAYWAPPLITARQLLTTLLRTLFTAPGALGQVLLGELPNVPYAQEAREQLAARRTAEQLKILALLLVVVALLVVPIVLLVA
jgi:hypothetical protein